MSVEAERAIVAMAMRSVESYDRSALLLEPCDFTDDRMRLCWELVTKLRDANRAADEITMASLLGKSARWTATGADDPYAYLNALATRHEGTRALDEYIELVKSAAVATTILGYCRELAEVAYDTTLTAEQKITEMHARLPVGGTVSSEQFIEYAKAAKLAIEQVVARASGEVSGLSSGMGHVDRMTGGWEPATLVILAGRPSHGKSVYAMDFAHAAASAGPVFVFSLEMSSANLAMRGLSSLGRVDYGDLRSGKIDEHMTASIGSARERMKAMPIYVDDRGGISVDQLRTRARVMARTNPPVLIVTDYLTLLSGVGENRTAQVGYVSRSLKALAKELNCPVLCLAQLNRGVDSRTDKRPTLSDLRDSGEIEQDADIVMFTYLHEKYDPDTPRKGCGELIFAKQRNGETGTVYCEWQGRYQRFIEWQGAIPDENEEPEEKPFSGLGKRGRPATVEEPF